MEPLLHLFWAKWTIDISRVLIDNKLGLSEKVKLKQIKKKLRGVSAVAMVTDEVQ